MVIAYFPRPSALDTALRAADRARTKHPGAVYRERELGRVCKLTMDPRHSSIRLFQKAASELLCKHALEYSRGTMKHSGPRSINPREGLNWLQQALVLLLRRPGLFIATALFAPIGSTVLLNLFELGSPSSGWFSVVTAATCYGLPLSIVVPLACALARVVNRELVPTTRQLLSASAVRVLGRTALFVFALLLQAYFTGYLLQDIIRPVTFASSLGTAGGSTSFGMFDSVLGAQ